MKLYIMRGALVNDIFADKIGANYSRDAASAVELAKKLAEQPAKLLKNGLLSDSFSRRQPIYIHLIR